VPAGTEPGNTEVSSGRGLRCDWGETAPCARGALRPSTRRPTSAPHPRSPSLSPQHPPTSPPPHLKPPAPRWAPPCGNCPWRRRDGRPSAARTWAAAAGPQRRPRPAYLATPSGAARPRPSVVAAPPEVWRRRAGPAC
jgi:hypothetical protein